MERASILSSYRLYKITVNFDPKLSANKHIEFTSLQINENKYDIGTLTVQNCVMENYPNIGIGTSPFSENPDIFTVMISNRESEPVTITEISYISGGNKINWLKSNVNIEGGKETDICIRTGFTEKNHTIRPMIVYEYKGQQYVDIAVVATEYTTSLDKKEILDYVNKNRK